MSTNLNCLISEKESHYLDQLEIANNKLKQANDIIEKSSIIIFEWSIGPGIPVKFVTKNISFFGYTEEEFYSEIVDYWDFVYEKDVEKTQKIVWQAREEKDLNEYKHIYRIKCKNGDIRWVEEWTILERNSNGEIISEKGVLRDITEQIETSEKLKQSEERYRSLFNNAGALIFTIDVHGNFTSINNACINLTGYDRETLLKMNPKDLLVLEGALPLDFDYITKFIIAHLGTNMQFSIHSKNNDTLILEGRATISYNECQPSEFQIIAQDVTSRVIAEKKIHHLTFHDKLTNLYNRAYFDDSLQKLEHSQEYPYSIIIGDMNGLKFVNDAFGHKVGDCLLIETANILRTCCPDKSIVARLSGDEFAMIIPNCSENEAMKVCRTIKEVCSKSNSHPIKPSIALGYSTSNDNTKTSDSLIVEADDNMYKNKLNDSTRTKRA